LQIRRGTEKLRSGAMSSTPAPDAFEVGGFVLLSGVARDPLAEQWIARARAGGPLVRVVRLTAETRADAEASAAFVANLDAIKNVEHPGIVRVVETRRDEDGVLGVLELFEGVTLRELCDASSEKKLPLSIVLRIAHDVASALAALAAEGIAHGDVTPSTILLLSGGVAVLVPSGLAVAVCRTPDAAPRARLAYKAPEQLRGDGAGATADVFGLAASLFEALGGRPAFAGSGGELRAALSRGRAAIGNAPADVPRALVAVLAQSLEADPKLRPVAARALARSLEDTAGVTAATRFDLAAFISEHAGRDIAALRFEVDLLMGKGGEPALASPPEPAVERVPVPAPRPELDAENTPRSGPPPAPPSKPSVAKDPDLDLFEDTQPSLAKIRAKERQRDRRRRSVIVGLAVAGIALVAFAISVRLRAAAEPAAAAAPPTEPPAAPPEPVPPPPEPVSEPEPEPAAPAPEAVAVSEPAEAPLRPARSGSRSPAAPEPEAEPEPAPAPPPKPTTTENPSPPRAEPPAYTAPSKPPPAPTVHIPAGI
jgi:serine/threonine protein kinase